MTENPSPSESDLTVGEAAADIGSTRKFIRSIIERGDLPAIKYGQRFIRIERSEWDAFKAAHRTTTPAAERAKLLGPETVRAAAESTDAAPPFGEEQRDTVRAAFRGGSDTAQRAVAPKLPRPNPRPKRVRR